MIKFKNLNIIEDLNVHNNVNNYGNTKITNTLDTNNLIVNSTSNLKGFINIENSLKSKYYNFDYNNEKKRGLLEVLLINKNTKVDYEINKESLN